MFRDRLNEKLKLKHNKIFFILMIFQTLFDIVNNNIIIVVTFGIVLYITIKQIYSNNLISKKG